MSKPKQKKSGTPAKRAKRAPARTEGPQQELLAALTEEHGRARRTMRLLLRVVAWLMQHRDAWSESEAKIPLDVLNADVDVGFYHDPEAGHLLVVPAPPTRAEEVAP